MSATKISLGGKTVEVEPLPFGILKKLQPRYLAFVDKMKAAPDGGYGFAGSTEELEEIGDIIRTALQTADASMNAEAFDGLRFTAFDLVAAFKQLGALLGLAEATPGEF